MFIDCIFSTRYLVVSMSHSKEDAESLEQANSWLTRRLHNAEQQVREGEEVNTTLTEENKLLKEVSLCSLSRRSNTPVVI